MIRILLADDQVSIRRQLEHSLKLEQDLEIIANAADGQDCLDQVSAHQPDIAIIDIEMPRMDGLTATRLIRDRCAHTKVLILSSHQDHDSINGALLAGAKGYLLKSTPPSDLAQAIRCIHSGYLQFAPGLLDSIGQNKPSIPKETLETLDPLDITTSDSRELITYETESDWSSLTQDLVDRHPQPWTKGLLYLLLIFAAIVLPWATFSKVDETGSARGRLEPNGQTWKLDTPLGGSVTKIAVQEGDTVSQGQILLELDSELVRRDLQQAQTKVSSLQTQVNQLNLMKHELVLAVNTQEQQNKAQLLEKQAQIQQAQQSVQDHQRSYELQTIEKRSPIDQAKADIESREQAVDLARQQLNQDLKEETRFRRLSQQGVIPQVQVVDKEKAVANSRQVLTEAEAHLRQAQLRYAEEQRRYQTLVHQAQSNIDQSRLGLTEQQESYQTLVHAGQLSLLKSQEQLKNIDSQITALTGDLQQQQARVKSLEYQLSQHQLKSPVAGVIFDLPINKAAAVLQPGARVAEIGQAQAPMILKAQMATAESGSLRLGMPVKLKFDAYPFQDYGVVPGTVSQISPTAKVVEASAGQLATFDLEITLAQTCIPTQSDCIALTPGQTASAEVILRQRRILDFIIDPVKKLQRGGLPL
ncbi:response regulator [Lyngbya confervoides]|uniref:Response regulator n=1 Tax=Lyngbya confervoides BDU141951 TaxID=1574623 RepID=A0ABD4T528_9CYAN|nr:response regulator [Lyngbya confervoides]MCM1983603.1 response regulator [Lyngbya confervoides BDU141951]